MSVHVTSPAYKTKLGNPTAKSVLARLAERANDDGSAFPSSRSIAFDTELSLRQVQRLLQVFSLMGLVTRHKIKTELYDHYYQINLSMLGGDLSALFNEHFTEKQGKRLTDAEPENVSETPENDSETLKSVCETFPPHPLIGVTVIEPSLNRKGEKRSTSAIEKKYTPPPWINPESWEGYIELRRHKRAVMTDRALNGVIARLEQFRARGHDPNEILDTSLRSNWTDVYEPKATGGFNGSIPNGKANANLGVLARVLAQTERTDGSNQDGHPALSVGRRNEPRALLENS